MSTFELKLDSTVFAEAKSMAKNSEFRKNDRGFKIGDKLILKEWVDKPGPYGMGFLTGQFIHRQITHVQEGFGIPAGYVVLSLERY